jgi:hypothetical protein
MEGFVKKRDLLFVLLGAGITVSGLLSYRVICWVRSGGLILDPPDSFGVSFPNEDRSISALYENPSEITLHMGAKRRQIDLEGRMSPERFAATPDGLFIYFIMERWRGSSLMRLRFPPGEQWLDDATLEVALDEDQLEKAIPSINVIVYENVFSCSDDGQKVLLEIRYCNREAPHPKDCQSVETNLVLVDLAENRATFVRPEMISSSGSN